LQTSLRREQKLREEKLIFQNETLKTQINPHFLFNSLNTLSALVVAQPVVAEEFIHRLSAIYRYILENGSKDRVPLSEELVFIGDYFYWKLISVILESIKSFLFHFRYWSKTQ
jgi:LytS/YehU family sensor histidine kinase